jgi:enediyne biosynthesis protein E4
MKNPALMKANGSGALDGSLRSVLQYSLCALVGAAVLTTNTIAQPVLVAPFTRITKSVFDENSARSMVAAWGDYDNDGWLDLFVGNNQGAGATHWLFRNNTNGTFTKVTSNPVTTDPAADPYGASWADYDNDGWLDLVVVSHIPTAPQPNRLYRNLGGGLFARTTVADVGSFATDAARTFSVTWADYDNDGYLDCFVANGDPGVRVPSFLYHNERNGSFTKLPDANNPTVTAAVKSAIGSWSDFDNDGDMDLFIPQFETEGNLLFRNDGLGQFVEVALASGLNDRANSVGAAWGDYDNDGDLDLFVNNVQFFGPVTPNFFYRNNGDGTFERITAGELAEDMDHFVTCAWVDYDNDGWLDLFLTVTAQETPTTGGVNMRLYRNQGDGIFVKVTQGRLVTDEGYTGGASWGDYNNDGFPDVFVSFGTLFTPQPSALYHNNGNSNSWIKIKCVGTMSNRSAIGTKIRALANIDGTNRWQMRQIVGSEGWLSFNSLDVVIGFGNATNIDTLRIEWPSGIVQEFHNVGVKQSLTIVERTTLAIERPSQGGFNVTVRGPRQQRYRLEASANLTSWSPVASLTITNVDGTILFKHTPALNDPQRFFRAAAE